MAIVASSFPAVVIASRAGTAGEMSLRPHQTEGAVQGRRWGYGRFAAEAKEQFTWINALAQPGGGTGGGAQALA